MTIKDLGIGQALSGASWQNSDPATLSAGVTVYSERTEPRTHTTVYCDRAEARQIVERFDEYLAQFSPADAAAAAERKHAAEMKAFLEKISREDGGGLGNGAKARAILEDIAVTAEELTRG